MGSLQSKNVYNSGIDKSLSIHFFAKNLLKEFIFYTSLITCLVYVIIFYVKYVVL